MPPKLNRTQADAYIAAVQQQAAINAENARIAAEIAAATAEQKRIDDAKKAADALAAAQSASTPTVTTTPATTTTTTTSSTPAATVLSEDEKRNINCFNAGIAKKNYVQYVNNKLTFNSNVTSSGNGCISDRPADFIVERGKSADVGLIADGDCYDESGINVSNEPTHVLYNSKSMNRLVNDNSCLSYNSDGSFNKVSQTPTFDFAAGWSFENNMLITQRDRNKAIRVNGENLEVADKQPGNLEFLWEREGGEFRNLKTNKCMNIKQMKVTPCVGSVRHTRWDYIDNKLLKNRRTGKCLDSNGTAVYTGNCSIDNGYQHWSIENNGSIIKHSSGKCLAQSDNNSKTELGLVDCKCEGITPGENSEKSYLDYINRFAAACQINEWGYNKTGDACLYMATQNYQILDKLLAWCDKNQKNESVNKYCFEFMKYNDLLQYYSRMCSEDNGVGEKPICIKIAVDSDTLILDEKAREFIKIKWDDAMYKSCEKGMIFTKADKDAKKFSWKYTVNDIDEECLDNWTFRDTSVTPVVDTIIKKTTSMGDNGYWCPVYSGNNDPRLNCSSHNKILNFLKTESKYNSYNSLWKEEGANTELPLRLYKKFVFRSDASLDTWRTYIRNEFKVNSSNKDSLHFAYFALFYGGFPIKVNPVTPFGVRYYSLNGKNYIYKESNYEGVKVARVTMTPKGPTGATPGFDVVVPPYREYFVVVDGVKKKITNTSNYYYLLASDSGTVYGIKQDGSKEVITPVSPFDNKEDNNDYSTAFILLLIILVVAVIVMAVTSRNKLPEYIKQREINKVE